jgi:quercetin dioxygenase-like cupin family protein
VTTYATRFGSLVDYEKGGVEIIDDDPRHYTFSNMFEVASGAVPWEKIAVAKNQEYVLEVIRAEGVSGWRSAAHDEFALVMDGTVVVELRSLTRPVVPAGTRGSIALAEQPDGRPMGRVVARRGHMALLPANAAHRFRADEPSVILLQTIAGADTVYRWSEICQTD